MLQTKSENPGRPKFLRALVVPDSIQQSLNEIEGRYDLETIVLGVNGWSYVVVQLMGDLLEECVRFQVLYASDRCDRAYWDCFPTRGSAMKYLSDAFQSEDRANQRY